MKKALRLAGTLLSVAMLVPCLLPIKVFAGASSIVIDGTTFSEGISSASWSNPEEDVYASDGKLIFPVESTKYTRLINKNVVRACDSKDELLRADMKVKLEHMPQGGEFILGFGLGNIESLPGNKGNLELVFINEGGIKAAIRAYEEQDQLTELMAARSVGASIGSDIAVEVRVEKDRSMTVKLNGQQIYTGVTPVSGEGRIGFLQSGQCKVSISDLNVVSYRYDRPENSNFTESFDDDTFNSNLLLCKMIHRSNNHPCVMEVREYEGDSVLIFENTGQAFLTTTQQYSNFELTFDVPHLLRKAILDDNYATLKPASSWLGISFGDDMMESNAFDYAQAPELVYFNTDSKVHAQSYNGDAVGESAEHAFFDINETRGFSVQLRVVDAHVTVGIKWLDEDRFTTLAEYETKDHRTPLGYVHIWTCGIGNFALDNINMVNLDDNAQVVETGYKAAKFAVPEDYEYTPAQKVYRSGEEAEGKNGLYWYLMIPCAAVVSVVVGLIGWGVSKKRKGREENNNEK